MIKRYILLFFFIATAIPPTAYAQTIEDDPTCQRFEHTNIRNSWSIRIDHDDAIVQRDERVIPVGAQLQKDDSERHMRFYSNSTGTFQIKYEIDFKIDPEEDRDISIKIDSGDRPVIDTIIKQDGFSYCILFDFFVISAVM